MTIKFKDLKFEGLKFIQGYDTLPWNSSKEGDEYMDKMWEMKSRQGFELFRNAHVAQFLLVMHVYASYLLLSHAVSILFLIASAFFFPLIILSLLSFCFSFIIRFNLNEEYAGYIMAPGFVEGMYYINIENAKEEALKNGEKA